MPTIRRIFGFVLMAWGVIRYLPDLLESAQATAKYGTWVYVHLSAPRSGVLTVVILVVGIGLIFSQFIQEKSLPRTVRSNSNGDSFKLQTSSKNNPDGSVEYVGTISRTMEGKSLEVGPKLNNRRLSELTANPARQGHSWMDLYHERKRLQDDLERLEARPRTSDPPFAVRLMTNSEMQEQWEKDRKIERKKQELKLIDERLKALTPNDKEQSIDSLRFVSLADRGSEEDRKKALEQAPQIVMEWDSPASGFGLDRVRLRNEGGSSALNLKVGEFSHPSYSWIRPIELQSLRPGEPEVNIEAEFGIGHFLGRLGSDEAFLNTPVSVDITFFDINGTEFIRTYTLHTKHESTVGSKSKVRVEAGQLRAKKF